MQADSSPKTTGKRSPQLVIRDNIELKKKKKIKTGLYKQKKKKKHFWRL